MLINFFFIDFNMGKDERTSRKPVGTSTSQRADGKPPVTRPFQDPTLNRTRTPDDTDQGDGDREEQLTSRGDTVLPLGGVVPSLPSVSSVDSNVGTSVGPRKNLGDTTSESGINRNNLFDEIVREPQGPSGSGDSGARLYTPGQGRISYPGIAPQVRGASSAVDPASTYKPITPSPLIQSPPSSASQVPLVTPHIEGPITNLDELYARINGRIEGYVGEVFKRYSAAQARGENTKIQGLQRIIGEFPPGDERTIATRINDLEGKYLRLEEQQNRDKKNNFYFKVGVLVIFVLSLIGAYALGHSIGNNSKPVVIQTQPADTSTTSKN